MTTMSLMNLKQVLDGPPSVPTTTRRAPSPSVTATLVADLHCELGECILYDYIKDTILFTDILGKKFHRLHLSPASMDTFQLPKMLAAFALLPQEQDGYLCAWEDGFQIYDIEHGKAISEMSQGEKVNPYNLPTRLNDGRCDRPGRRFICGGYYGDVSGNKMKVYKCEYQTDGDQLTHQPILDEIEITNSICFSLDGNTMYLADSSTQQIHSYSYDTATGSLSNKTLLHANPSMADPDGSCIDAQGYLWNAVWRGGDGPSFVQRIDPMSGDVVFVVHMPDTTSQVSCCCFGGKDLNVLFITTAAVSRDATVEPNAGGLYAVKLDFIGLKEDRFRGR